LGKKFIFASVSGVIITVYNVKGQKVTTLVDKHFENGSHTVTWNGKDNNNKAVASGIYFYKISTGKSSAMKKMLLLK
jgi:flagellar hook assembly protein FlgD